MKRPLRNPEDSIFTEFVNRERRVNALSDMATHLRKSVELEANGIDLSADKAMLRNGFAVEMRSPYFQ